MKVNMTPNPLDVVTIHASQGDTEARQWEFELHNNGELIDTSEITEQLFFKAYKGGTEQILPENTSTPTTSPFKGDIKYPQGLLTDQEFLYRESPTEEDGLVKITDIKGNTLVWNQLAPSMSSSVWAANRCTKTVSGNTFSLVGTNNSSMSFGVYIALTNLKLTVNHNYLFMCVVNPSRGIQVRFTFDSDGRYTSITPNKDNVYSRVVSAATEGPIVCYVNHPSSITTSDTATIKNLMIVDLTMLNDSRITDLNSFKTFYPLPYYAYNQGSLLSFMGNGIKTVGFNQWDEVWESGRINADGTKVPSSTYIRSKNYIHIFPNTTYYRKSPNNIQPFYYDGNMNFISYGLLGANSTFVTPNNAEYMLFHIDPTYGTTYKNDICINISNTESNGTYEPYTSSTLSLPISTYFPTGMKSAGTVYDELTATKGITRIGAVDLGSLNWTYDSSVPRFTSSDIVSAVAVPSSNSNIANIKCAVYDSISLNGLVQSNKCIAVSTSGVISVKDTAYTSASAFKSSLSGTYLYYELATPTETSFTTASLVTENAEIPLSNEDGVLVGKCTEQLSAEPGFHDAKIKLSDSDGECYSNKIQLHVERSPQ